MIEFDFFDYYEESNKIIIYGESLHEFFNSQYGIIIDTIDFDNNQNVILFIEPRFEQSIEFKKKSSKLEKKLFNNIKHLNDVEIKNSRIILTFDSDNIELR